LRLSSRAVSLHRVSRSFVSFSYFAEGKTPEKAADFKIMDPETEKKAEETGKSVLGRLKDWGCEF
jgi:hypothetical protein